MSFFPPVLNLSVENEHVGTEDGEERKMAKKEEGLFLACAQTGKSETGTKEELRIALTYVHHPV